MPVDWSNARRSAGPTSSRCVAPSASAEAHAVGASERTHRPRLLPLLVACLLVVLHHCSRGHFLGPLAVAARLLGRLFDVLVLALLLGASASNVLSSWHVAAPPRYRRPAQIVCRQVCLDDSRHGIQTTPPARWLAASIS